MKSASCSIPALLAHSAEVTGGLGFVRCQYPIYKHEVDCFVMPVIESNMYVLADSEDALVIDPCISAQAETLLKTAGTKHCTVLLTHEHYDHISGVNRLRELFDCEVICSRACASRITDPRKNAAAYFSALFLQHDRKACEKMKSFIDTGYRCEATAVYDGAFRFDWHGMQVLLQELPGHSKGSQIIQIGERYVFTGDYMIPGKETITRLPGGSREEYERIVLPYLQRLPEGCVVYPGHGKAFEKNGSPS